MICPQCGAEYRQGFTQCSDCHVSLVSELPRGAEQADEELVVIASYLNYMQAEMARGMLESSEVEAFLMDDNLARVAGHISAVVGGVKLGVRRSDEDHAREILSSLGTESPGTHACPKCGFENTDFFECANCGQILTDVGEPEGGDATTSPAAEELLCPACETPYRLEDYDPQAPRIYCTACKTELPRHAVRTTGYR